MQQHDFRRMSRELSNREGVSNSLILFAIGAFIVLGVIWARETELDNVTRGDGRIVSNLQNQLIQATESGVILQRMVSENDNVSKGDILFKIDPIDAQSELDRLVQREATLSIKEARLNAEISGQAFKIAEDLRRRAPEFSANEESLFTARQQELENEVAILNQQLHRGEADLRAARDSNDSAQKLLSLIENEIRLVEPLVAEKLAPETRLLELKREAEQAKSETLKTATAINASEISIAETERKIEARRHTYVREAMDSRAQTIADRRELLKTLPSIRERVTRSTVMAPVDGIVNRINYLTDGAYVSAGDVLVELVPTGDGLKLEGRIDPKDISNIRIGDEAKIRLSAYDSAKYGAMKGSVTAISPDAIAPNQGEGSSYYAVDIIWTESLILEDGRPVTLIPGMTATVDVVSGKRSILEYFWQPIARIQELALRD